MNAKRIFGFALMLGLVAILGAGCAKKTIDVMPEGATKSDRSDKDTGWQDSAGAQDSRSGSLSEDQLRAQQREQAQREVGNMVFFPFDSYELDQAGKDVLTAKAESLKKYPQFTINIEGHCDERGTSEYNLALGERRAKVAQEFLNQLGIADTRMNIVSFGKERPFVQGHDEAAWSKNRRDEFKILE